MDNNSEILKKIKTIQYAIDDLIEKNAVTFKSQNDIKTLEEIYDYITGRRYVRFNGSCGSCIREALLITNNFLKREMKKEHAEKDALKEVIKPATRAKKGAKNGRK